MNAGQTTAKKLGILFEWFIGFFFNPLILSGFLFKWKTSE
jgi:hypothetical protein